MRIAVLTDIHANLEALEACLADAEDAGAGRLVFLGDLVGYGADPWAVAARVRILQSEGAVVLRGNHDEAACFGPRGFSAMAAAAMRWTMDALPAEAREWLAGLPLTHAEDDRLYTHADASDPGDWRYVSDARAARRSLLATQARLTLCGHTHVPALWRLADPDRVVPVPLEEERSCVLDSDHRWLAVVGAVGQPRNGHSEACYALLDAKEGRFTPRRVAYDVTRAADKIRAAGLPELLAERLFVGV
jgi:diadenosine tetraphosphatase ApaH/serine/threonine PP2A family protein phosphatase